MSGDGVGFRVDISTADLTRVAKSLQRAELTAVDRHQLLGDLGQEIEDETQERFDKKIDPEGRRWQAIAERTRTSYQKRRLGGNPRPPLVISGQLRDTIESQVEGEQVAVGETMIYAAVHQFGWKDRNIPARASVGISADNEAALAELVNAFIDGKLGVA